MQPDANPLQALVVDDEPIARERLGRLLREAGGVQVAAECPDGGSAVVELRSRAFDLVFLDVQMPGLTGFDVVREVGPARMPAVVFVTAFDRFALQAFEAEAVDYLLKPFGAARLAKALTRARQYVRGGRDDARSDQLTRLLAATRTPPNFLLVRDRDRVVFVCPQDLDWVEADADYAFLHVGSETHHIRSTLGQLEERLAPEGFVRIHRSRLVNLNRIKEFRRLSQGETLVVLKTGDRLTASAGYLRLLQERLGLQSV